MKFFSSSMWLGLCLCVSLFKLSFSFQCSDNCTIPDHYAEDYFCDCSDCSDEYWFNCTTCEDGCPSTCDGTDIDTHYCFNATYFECDDGCRIHGSWVDDSWCDCMNCEDEGEWNCTTCDCPSECGDWNYCLGSSYSYGNYTCNDGCQIPNYWVDDNWCDCSDCGDETYWGCNNCTDGCPTICGDYNYCPGYNYNYNYTYSTWDCNDGCSIYSGYVNDDWCDCSECEDEDYWTCDNCDCPVTCGDYEYCDSTTYYYGNFTCDDGCQIYSWWVNDDFCDCSNCEDEMTTGWDCTNCECPDDCGDYHFCTGSYTVTDSTDSSSSEDSSGSSGSGGNDGTTTTGAGNGGEGGEESSSSSSSAFDQGTSAGRAALAVLIIGIIIILVIGCLIVAKQLGHKNTSNLQAQKQGILEMDGNANDNSSGVGIGMGMATHNGTLAGPNSEPDKYEENNNNNNNSGQPQNTWNQMIDIPDEPQNTNDNENGGEVSVQQQGNNIVLPEQPKVDADRPTPGNDDPFEDDGALPTGGATAGGDENPFDDE